MPDVVYCKDCCFWEPALQEGYGFNRVGKCQYPIEDKLYINDIPASYWCYRWKEKRQ